MLEQDDIQRGRLQYQAVAAKAQEFWLKNRPPGSRAPKGGFPTIHGQEANPLDSEDKEPDD